MRVWFDMLTRRDARLLARWWNANDTGFKRYFVRRSPTNRRFWCLMRQD